MTNKLKPCPWCGREAVMRSHDATVHFTNNPQAISKQTMYSASCSSEWCCECPSGWHKSKGTATKRWNTRASDDATKQTNTITWEQQAKKIGIAEFMGTPLTELSEHKQEVFWEYIRKKLKD